MGGILKLAHKLLVIDRASSLCSWLASASLFPHDRDVVDVCWRIEPGVPTVINIIDPAMKNVSNTTVFHWVLFILRL